MTPFLLSGGINPYSVKAIREFHHPKLAGIDINSRFETAPGNKDVERIGKFLQAIRTGEMEKALIRCRPLLRKERQYPGDSLP